MEMTGEFHIPASRERVWEALNDPEILKQCIPGCETIEKVSPTEFTAKVVAKVGPVRASFGGKVNLSDLDPPKGYTISGEGSGGVAGFAKGSAKVDLDEEGAHTTLLKYAVQAHVGGKLAQIGSRLIDATSRKMAADFFERFAGAVAPAPAAEPAPQAAPTPAEPAPEPAEPSPEAAKPKDLRLPPVLWVTGLAAIVGAMLYFFTGRRVTR
ncbi:MAG TPA: carbon monoxide dehydrogenase subunit G [Stellaceae bacterium]|jgi:hypothetical protein